MRFISATILVLMLIIAAGHQTFGQSIEPVIIFNEEKTGEELY